MAPGPELDDRLLGVASSFGTPAYAYFTSSIERRIAELRGAFGGRFALSYAVKSNPNPALLAWLEPRIDMLDVSSIGELRSAMQAGWAARRASFTGPAKRDFELREAIERGVGELVIESVGEARRADQIAKASGRLQDVMVRISPAVVPRGFGDQMAGKPSPFGIDQEALPAELPKLLALTNLSVVGLHIYSGTQCLKAETVAENYANFIAIFREVCAAHDLRPKKLVFGSGLGLAYHDGDAPLDLDDLARRMIGELDALKREPRFRDARLIVELGRYLVGEAGYFLTRVISIKESRGTRIAVCDGGMNNHLPASGHFGMVVHRNFSMHKVGGSGPAEKVDLVGPLCTSIDRLAKGAMLPRLDEGDLVAVHNSGAYGLTASPIHFIGHAPPREILVGPEGPFDVTHILDGAWPLRGA